MNLVCRNNKIHIRGENTMHFGIPQIINIILTSLILGMSMVEHGKQKTGNENFFTTLIGVVMMNGLLYWGGFYK